MGRTSFLPTLKMKTKTIIKSLCAGILASVLSASAGVLSLPTPPQSEYVDGESSLCIPLDSSRGPLVRIRIAADFSPSNAVVVAFGTDANADGDLSPEETDRRVGCDCENWIAPNPLALKLGQWDLAKVTTHNFTATNLVVTLSRIGTTIFVR